MAVRMRACVGYASDRYGRKAVVYVAGTMMAVIPLILIVTTNFTVMILSGLIFGLAYGSYITYVPLRQR
jgi:MFS family permease